MPSAQVTQSQFDALSGDVSLLAGRVAGLESQVGGLSITLQELDRALSGGVAAAMAMGGPALAPGSNMSLSMSVANYQGEQAIAGNLTGKIAEDVYISAGLSGNTGDRSLGTRATVLFGF
ncbi:MAG: hypothetical protein CL801_08420 [Citromicrobium sp.]|nr:hypothetical protein [Citromicrobium sp.]